MVRFRERAASAAFALGSIAVVEQSRHLALRAIGRHRRGEILDIIVSEWSVCEAVCSDQDVEDFRKTLTDRVRDRVREHEWGFIWWLPLVMAVVEIIIKLLIERWTERE